MIKFKKNSVKSQCEPNKNQSGYSNMWIILGITPFSALRYMICLLFTHRWTFLGAICATILVGPGFGTIGCKSATILEIDSVGRALAVDGFFLEAGPGRGLDKGPGPDCWGFGACWVRTGGLKGLCGLCGVRFGGSFGPAHPIKFSNVL